MLADGVLTDKDMEPTISGFEFYIEAFYELGTSRPIGLSVGPIPFTAIADYCRIYKIEDFEEFRYLMRRMDRVFLEHSNKTSSKSSDSRVGGKKK